MRLLGLFAALALALSSIAPAEESPGWQKIQNTSPDKKYALRISCDSEPADPENISDITALDLISLPDKKVVLSLAVPNLGTTKIIWSSDSKWFAYNSSDGPRVGYTHVCRFHDGKFVEIASDDVRAEVKGNVRNEYVNPVRWLKPGTLVLEQQSILREEGDVLLEMTVAFDEAGKFRIVRKKKLSPKED